MQLTKLLSLALTACAVLATALPAPLTAQTAVLYGTITDTADGRWLIGANVSVASATASTYTDFDGGYRLVVPAGTLAVSFEYYGYTPQTRAVHVAPGDSLRLDVGLVASVELEETVVVGYGSRRQRASRKDSRLRTADAAASTSAPEAAALSYATAPGVTASPVYRQPTLPHAGEAYAHRDENRFTLPQEAPLSTFGADVDVAAYANVRRFLQRGQRPPADAVRTEELVNYFDYAYAKPTGPAPVAFSNELGPCPWNPAHRLLRIGVRARALDTDALPPSNLVFLLDVSGSMNQPDKLPLLKQSFRLLTEQLRDEDRVSIVVYAGAAGTVLEPTRGSARDSILQALDGLRAGGSTAGGAGILLAYRLAERHFVEGGNNRIVLATDGDFNVGTTANESLEDLVARKRETGVFLSVLGFGQGNYQDARMQTLAEAGNGNAVYIDNLLEAQKVLVEEFGGTMYTVAKDVKLQVEFNPALASAYRLIGYESRLLAPEDFHDDRKDAGDMGSGHTVTALYEVIPAGVESAWLPRVEPLKYQRVPDRQQVSGGAELATVRMKYKRPDAERSAEKIEVTVAPTPTASPSADFRWASAVAGWSLLLQDSDFVDEGFGYAQLLPLAEGARGEDARGYRAEALRLMGVARGLEEVELVGR